MNLFYNNIDLVSATFASPFSKERNMDIVVKIHLASRNSVDRDILECIVTKLIKAVYTGLKGIEDVDEIGFIEGSLNKDGVNALQIRTLMDPMTKNELEDALTRIFEQKFEISLGDTTKTYFNRKNEIEAAARHFTPRGK